MKIIKLVQLGIILTAAIFFPVNLQAARELAPAEDLGELTPVTFDFNKVIADFNINNGNPPNNVGGDFGELIPNSPCEFVADAPDAFGNLSGHAMRLYHNFSDSTFYSCTFFSRLGPDPIQKHTLNASSYKSLSFYVKGDASTGFGDKIRVALQDLDLAPHTVITSGISDQWKRITIPLLQFQRTPRRPNYQSVLDLTGLTDLDMTFDRSTNPEVGKIFVDQISLSPLVSNLTIADFEVYNYDVGSNINNVGGLTQTWSNEFNGCTLGFTQGHVYVPFNLTHIAAGCALYMRLGREPVRDIPLNTSDYKTISFDVKGNMNSGAPLFLKIELDDASYFKSFNYITGITSDWKTYSIPIAAFGRQIDKTRLTQFTITADTYLTGIPSSGQFYVDNVILKPQVSDLLLADFNAANVPNNLYALYGEFTGGGQCMASRVADASGDPQGHALRVDYGGMDPVDPYCGIWLETGPESIDLRDYRFLKMKVKGDSDLGFPLELRLDLYLTYSQDGDFVHIPVTSSWEEVVVDLRDFLPIAQLGSVGQLSITIDSNDPAQGAVYLDDIRFTRRRVDLNSEAIAAEAVAE